MMSFLYRKTQSGFSTKSVIFWKKATVSLSTPVYPTPLCYQSSNILLQHLPPPTSRYLCGKDTSVNSLALLQFRTAVKTTAWKEKNIS